MPRKSIEEKAPKGGWLGPPPNTADFKLAAIATVVGSKKGSFIWKENVLSGKERKRHAKFQKAMKAADKEGSWAI